MKIRVIYNPSSLLSCLAALLTKVKINANNNSTNEHHVILAPYQRYVNHKVTETANHFIVTGTEMHPLHLEEEVKNLHPNGSGVIFAQPGTYEAEIYTCCGVKAIHQAADMDQWIRHQFKESELGSELYALVYLVMKYEHHQSLTEEQMYQIFANEKAINNAVAKNELWTPATISNSTPDEFKDRLTISRTIIERGLEMRDYKKGMQGFKKLTINVLDLFTHYCIRLLSYPHKQFIVYEDLKDCRLWRIYANLKEDGAYMATFLDPQDTWREGNITYVISHAPSTNN